MQSMTGCGRCQVSGDGRELTCELKTVNHRFLDLSLRVPRELSFLEEGLRRSLNAGLRRGHVDVTITYRNLRGDARRVAVDDALLQAYVDAAARMKETTGAADDLTVSRLMELPGVVTVTAGQEDAEAVETLAADALRGALTELTAMRAREGASLQRDLTLHLEALSALQGEIAELAPQVPALCREKLAARLAQLPIDPVDPQRLAQEVAIFADHAAIDEELSRLASHIAQMRHCLGEEGETGRRLDFLTQEMNREVNTIGSKASHVEITNRVLQAKSEIEKLREQVQNVE